MLKSTEKQSRASEQEPREGKKVTARGTPKQQQTLDIATVRQCEGDGASRLELERWGIGSRRRSEERRERQKDRS